MRAPCSIEHLNCFFNGKKNLELCLYWHNEAKPTTHFHGNKVAGMELNGTYVWALRTGALACQGNLTSSVQSCLSKCPWGTNFHAKSHFALYHSLYFKWGKRNLTFCWLCMPGLLQQLWSVQGLNMMWYDVLEIWIKNLITLCISLYSWRCHHPLGHPR